jgi:hypothetical protein
MIPKSGAGPVRPDQELRGRTLGNPVAAGHRHRLAECLAKAQDRARHLEDATRRLETLIVGSSPMAAEWGGDGPAPEDELVEAILPSACALVENMNERLGRAVERLLSLVSSIES